jgi:hypothetical protein
MSGPVRAAMAQFFGIRFQVSAKRGAKSSYETFPFKPEKGHLIRPRRRTRARPRNRKQFKSIEDEDDCEATDELN